MLTNQHEHSPDETIADLINESVRLVHHDKPFEHVLPELLTSKVIVLIDDLRNPIGILTMIDALEFTASRNKE